MTYKAEGEELKWLDKVCALLEQDKKMQWVIGDALLEGERWRTGGGFGAELHAAKKQSVKHTEPEGEEAKVPYQMGIKGHDPLDEVVKRTGYDKSSLQDFMRVARVFPDGKREMALSWSHHQACAAEWLTDKQRDDLLGRAQNQKLSVGALRQQVRELNTDEFASAKGYQQLHFHLPQTKFDKLNRIAKKEKRKLPSLIEQAVDLLLDEYADKQTKTKVA